MPEQESSGSDELTRQDLSRPDPEPEDQSEPQSTQPTLTQSDRPVSRQVDRAESERKKKEDPLVISPRQLAEVPFPQRLTKAKEEKENKIFFHYLKQLHITIPFTHALTQMPKYVKFLKDLLTNKRKLDMSEKVILNEQCSYVMLKKLPPKKSDLGRFTLPCNIGQVGVRRALCDIGASVSLMPRSMFDRIGLGELSPTEMMLQLADQSTKSPLGKAHDILVQVGKFLTPCDFVVVEMEEDVEVPIILGRPFLTTIGALIDCIDGSILLRVGDEKVKFDMDEAMRKPLENTVFMVKEVLVLVEEALRSTQPNLFKYLSDLEEAEADIFSDICFTAGSLPTYLDSVGPTRPSTV